MKITIDYGHTLSGGDTGASGCGRKEQDLTREVGTRVVALLREVGNTVHEIRLDYAATVRESMNWRVSKINSLNPDYSISIHFNAHANTSAHGSEVWIGTGVTDKANRILANFAGLGFTNRGLKDGIGAELALVKNTNMPAMLVECCFITNAGDMSKYNADKFARIIANGLDSRVSLNSVTNSNTSNTTNNTSGVIYRVRNANNEAKSQAGAFKNLNNAKNCADKNGLCVWNGNTCIYTSVKADIEFNAHLRDLQSAYNADYDCSIYVDGLRGPQVEDMLNRLCLQSGSKGNCVSWLQCRIGVKIDGDFGPNTRAAVIKFQTAHGLKIDGIAGKQTFNKLLEIFH